MIFEISIQFVAPNYLPFPISPFDIPDIKKPKLLWEWAWKIKKKD